MYKYVLHLEEERRRIEPEKFLCIMQMLEAKRDTLELIKTEENEYKIYYYRLEGKVIGHAISINKIIKGE